ncbi:DUF7260 family protein [Haloferax profundi]|uniref:DUF7260 domain-containing protein n=1 Tax=Haloferax profundi TaxID=1544718 RepID=A0A0W1S0G8_9EURY|nr:hypothetical protein [Haloferax profundi]KTG19481.1 hypothetical protein AUR66_02355 [Haloferax profundi]
MAVSLTRLDAAQEALRRERRRCVDEREAFRAFRSDLSDLTATTPAQTPMAAQSLGHVQANDGSLTRVRRSYERTVMSVPHYDEEYGDTFEDSMVAEFGPDVAVAFQSASVFSPALHQTVTSAAATARSERDEFIEVLDEETASIESMRERLSSLLDRLVALDDRPLSERGFGELLALYEQVSVLRSRLETIASDRQETLVAHRRALSSLIPDVTEFLYEDLPCRYPVLATLADVRETLDTAERRVERHIASTP